MKSFRLQKKGDTDVGAIDVAFFKLVKSDSYPVYLLIFWIVIGSLSYGVTQIHRSSALFVYGALVGMIYLTLGILMKIEKHTVLVAVISVYLIDSVISEYLYFAVSLYPTIVVIIEAVIRLFIIFILIKYAMAARKKMDKKQQE